MKHFGLCAAIVSIGALVTPAPLAAQAIGQTGETFTLASAIRTALARNPIVRSEGLRVEATRQQVRSIQARRRIPSMLLTTDTGLVPEARGDVFDSPNSSDSVSGLAPFIRTNLVVVMPLFTFGALSNAERAALAGLAAKEDQRQQTQNRISLQVAQAYWAIVGSRKALEVAQEMQDQYEEFSEQVHTRYEEEPDGFELIDDTDVLEIETNRYDVERVVLQSTNGVQVAIRFFNALLLRSQDLSVAISETPSLEIRVEESQIPELVRLAEQRHPQVRALSAATEALESRMRAQQSKKLPGVFLVGSLGFAHAGNRTDQKNPFVVDEFNFFRGAVAFRIRWNLDFGQNNIEYQRLRLERDSTLALREALTAGLFVQVDRATREVLLNRALLQRARKAQISARSWLRLSLDNWELGIGEVKRLLDAYRAFYRLRAEVIERELAANVSIAKLAFAMGDPDLYLRWITDEKVQLD